MCLSDYTSGTTCTYAAAEEMLIIKCAIEIILHILADISDFVCELC